MPATSFRLCPDKRLKNKKSRKAFALQDSLRKDRDSNPGNLSVQRFSRPPQSTTLPSLLVSKTGAKVDSLFELCKFFVLFIFTFFMFYPSISDSQTHKNIRSLCYAQEPDINMYREIKTLFLEKRHLSISFADCLNARPYGPSPAQL